MDKGDGDSPRRRQAEIVHQRGRNLFNIDQFERAFACFAKAAAVDPSFLPAHLGRANCLVVLGRAQQGLALADEVVSLQPDYPFAHVTRAIALAALGRRDEALAAYRQAAAHGPEDPLVFFNLACFWGLEGNEDECRETLTRALELRPDAYTKAIADPAFAAYHHRPWFQNFAAYLRTPSTRTAKK